MTKFFVGQRVRMVRSVRGNNGWEGRIRTFDVDFVDSGYFDVYVDWDHGLRDGPSYLGFSGFAANTWQLAPILPDGHRAGDFSTVQELMDSLRVTA